MSLSLTLSVFWVLSLSAVALMPMKYQRFFGLPLLIATPFLAGFVAYQHGIWLLLLFIAAAVSMFRRPLVYFGRIGMARLKEGAQ